MLESSAASRRLPNSRDWIALEEGADLTVRPPAGYRVIKITTDSTPEVEDLASFRRDLEMARQYGRAYVASDISPEDSRPDSTAFWIAAVIAYGRAFSTGVREAKVGTEHLTDDQLELHQYFLDLRNKYAAHSVNGYEGATAMAYVPSSAFHKPHIARVGQVQIESAPLGDEDLTAFIELCTTHVKALQRRIEALHRKIMDELYALGSEKVYAMPDLAILADMGREVVSKRRKR